MIIYKDIDPAKPDGRRTAAGLLRLRRALAKELPPKRVDGNLLLATWNVRELGNTKFGGRTRESLYYIAEIVSAFDLVAVEEVRSDVTSFKEVRALLGPWWKFLVSDVTQGVRGNNERIGFLYDSRKVEFGGLASGVVLPPIGEKGRERGAATVKPVLQPARTPMLVSMRAGWLGFTICATHSIYGKGVADYPPRVQEIGELARFLKGRVEDRFAWSPHMFLVGDLNIYKTTDKTFQKLTEAGFIVPKPIVEARSNAKQDKHYDQIAFLSTYLAKRTKDGSKQVIGGAFDFYKHVYREEDARDYASRMGAKYTRLDAKKKKTYFRNWRTYQMSDHLPLWVGIDTDFSYGYLANKYRGKSGPPATPAVRRRHRARKKR